MCIRDSLLFSGPELVFWLVSAGFLFFVMMLYQIHTLETELSNRQSKGMAADFMEGFRYSISHMGIRNMILFTALMSFLLRPLAELMPGISDNVFGRGPEGLAWLLAAFGLGSLLSSVYLALRTQNKGLARIYLFYFATGSITLVIFSIFSNFWVALLLVTIFGFSTNTVPVASQSMFQHMVSEPMRARTMGLLGLTFRAVPFAGRSNSGLCPILPGHDRPPYCSRPTFSCNLGRLGNCDTRRNFNPTIGGAY